MPATEADLITDEEEFHSSYRIYLQALEMLAETPENQCQLMGDYNVAWELKEDVAAGRYLVNRGYLSAAQEAWVVAMAAALEAIDTLVLPAGPGRDVNLLAMQNPNWEPLRYLAAEVVRQLAPFTELNSSYLKLGNSAA
jgi:Asp-tRNA(Asn)/Glu-tRNA(Gln) amidotransferase A subunit family amidase